ncbi:MAG TPA: S8 family serine peptidase [Caulobacteraceae bacterium]|nr:S8 family serine peptidase [Caulobacteraceae bacterium]
MRRLAVSLAALVAGLAAGSCALAQASPPTPGASEILVFLRMPPPHLRAGPGPVGDYGDDGSAAGRRRLAARIARAEGLSLVTDWPIPLLGVDCYVMSPPRSGSVEDAATRIAQSPGVAWTQAMHRFDTQGHAQARAAAPNDPLFPIQPAASQWRLAALYQVSTGRGVRVAVIDSEVDTAHPDLAGQVEVKRDFVRGHPAQSEAHGTGVAGVIAARANNGLGIAGVAPEARLLALRACWQTGSGAASVCDSLSLAEALHFAIEHGAEVINLSLSGPEDVLLSRLIDVAMAHGAQVVAAFDPALPHGGFPASHPGVIAVGADGVAGASAAVYTAPGRDVPTTQPGGRWGLVDGSSYAAAEVSGLLALLREHDRPRHDPLVLAAASGGAIDACASVLRASGRGEAACPLGPGLTVGRH